MTELTFYGASDDIFVAGNDEFYAPYNVIVVSEGGQLVVSADYLSNGVWAIGIAPVDEDIPIPAWPARFDLAERGYSARLTLTVPGKATVRQLKA